MGHIVSKWLFQHKGLNSSQSAEVIFLKELLMLASEAEWTIVLQNKWLQCEYSILFQLEADVSSKASTHASLNKGSLLQILKYRNFERMTKLYWRLKRDDKAKISLNSSWLINTKENPNLRYPWSSLVLRLIHSSLGFSWS